MIKLNKNISIGSKVIINRNSPDSALWGVFGVVVYPEPGGGNQWGVDFGAVIRNLTHRLDDRLPGPTGRWMHENYMDIIQDEWDT